MDPSIARQLVDKLYEKRKAAALELEKQIRECHTQKEQWKINQIIDQLIEMFSNPSNPLHVKNGGLIGLAGTAIALGVDVAPFMNKFIDPLLVCFSDPENRIRYFSAECLYNVAKVSKGEILVYFNPLFDALSKLAADSELSVKNGAELLDRLLKDIVAESASFYIPQHAEMEKENQANSNQGILVPYPEELGLSSHKAPKKAFSLAHFIPLLSERIYVVNPFTRSFLVSWITVLDSVPELELIAYLPQFLDGLLKYLSDPTEDVRVATENLLAEILREIRYVATVQKRSEEKKRIQQTADAERALNTPLAGEKLPEITMSHPERAAFLPEGNLDLDNEEAIAKDGSAEPEYRDTGAYIPGQSVVVDHASIVQILIQQLDNQHDEIQQSTALYWLAEYLSFAQDVLVPFTPQLIPAILPNLSHHVPMIQSAAVRTNHLLFSVIQGLPTPALHPPPSAVSQAASEKPTTSSGRNGSSTVSPPNTASSVTPSRQTTLGKEQLLSSRKESVDSLSDAVTSIPYKSTRGRASTIPMPIDPPPAPPSSEQDSVSASQSQASRSQTPTSTTSTSANIVQQVQPSPPLPPPPVEIDPFDYQATVNMLTIQFLSEHEQTRVAALKWLIMLHQKAPRKILSMDDGTFPALLKTLSDSSEEVIKHDLQLLAQISSSSEEGYFRAFIVCLLELFSTDRRLLETRGSLIIRELCTNLTTERIYRTLAEILEKEEDLEFASDMIQKLNLILITSPELADFRRRLKSLETRQDGQALFTTLYRSWCHNAVAVFSLCLLAQAYEHASNLLSIFADLEITVQLLVQIDKLVQLIESPVFTYIRLQLLEPERYPYLFKCLYGLLMILPQSMAFVSLKNRLNAVNSAGFLHIAPRSSTAPFSARSKLGRGEEIKWQELLTHFRSVQARHEKARRQALGIDRVGITSSDSSEKTSLNAPSSSQQRPQTRRKVTGEVSSGNANRPGALSPLNPKSRGGGFFTASQSGANRPRSPTQTQNKARRTLTLKS